MNKRLYSIQNALRDMEIDGWLLYDFCGSNPLFWRVLHFILHGEMLPFSTEKIPHMTRRLFYWIPAEGPPLAILHAVEEHGLSSFFSLLHTALHEEKLPGETELFFHEKELWKILHEALKAKKGVPPKRIAMESSSTLPTVSFVDGGTVDRVRSLGVEVVSSSSLSLPFTACWEQRELIIHREAMAAMEEAIAGAWKFLTQRLPKEANQEERNRSVKAPSERELQEVLLKVFHEKGIKTESPPICAVNAHSADPHYEIQGGGALIKRGDWVLIDLWGKKPGGVYADITRVASLGPPSPDHQKIFDLVASTKKSAMEKMRRAWKQGETIEGWMVDEWCRLPISQAGYAPYFCHRSGHHIDREVHGLGTHFDSIETFDTRPIYPGMCFSLEPGIYLPEGLPHKGGKGFGVRLEHNLYFHKGGEIEITGGEQTQIDVL